MIRLRKDQQGFTIIELMIATVIFSTILVFVSAMMIGISRLYYKGLNQAAIQDATRNAVQQISDSLQLTDRTPLKAGASDDDAPPPVFPGVIYTNGASRSGDVTTEAYCLNNVRYSFVKNVRMGDEAGESPHILWRDTGNSTSSCVPLNLSQRNLGKGTELGLEGARLIEFSLTPMPNQTRTTAISIVMAYGDDELLKGTGTGILCKGGRDTQFCSISKLNTTVTRRLGK